jgi:hypothetical protein
MPPGSHGIFLPAAAPSFEFATHLAYDVFLPLEGSELELVLDFPGVVVCQ